MGRCKSSKRITTIRQTKNSIQGNEKNNKTPNGNDKDVKGVSDIIDYNLDGTYTFTYTVHITYTCTYIYIRVN
jgi:hypothetical protein